MAIKSLNTLQKMVFRAASKPAPTLYRKRKTPDPARVKQTKPKFPRG